MRASAKSDIPTTVMNIAKPTCSFYKFRVNISRKNVSAAVVLLVFLIGLLFVYLTRDDMKEPPTTRYPGACPSAAEYLTPTIPRCRQGIPKILHQVYKSFILPQEYQPLVQRCSEINSDFLHILWTDDDFLLFLRTQRPEWLLTYKKYTSGIQKSDVMRLMILEHFGGVYIDLDVECRRPLSLYLEAHNASCIFDREPELQTQLLHFRTKLLMNSAILAVPHHPFLKYLIGRLEGSFQEESTLHRTGPMFITDRYFEFERSNPLLSKTIYHAPSSHFSPILDPQVVLDITWYCTIVTRISYIFDVNAFFHPLVVQGCKRWNKDPLLHGNYTKQAIEKSYLVHRFLHLGYLRPREFRQVKKYSICDELATLTRYGSFSFETTEKIS